jgi:hypothetical protein
MAASGLPAVDVSAIARSDASGERAASDGADAQHPNEQPTAGETAVSSVLVPPPGDLFSSDHARSSGLPISIVLEDTPPSGPVLPDVPEGLELAVATSRGAGLTLSPNVSDARPQVSPERKKSSRGIVAVVTLVATAAIVAVALRGTTESKSVRGAADPQSGTPNEAAENATPAPPPATNAAAAGTAASLANAGSASDSPPGSKVDDAPPATDRARTESVAPAPAPQDPGSTAHADTFASAPQSEATPSAQRASARSSPPVAVARPAPRPAATPQANTPERPAAPRTATPGAKDPLVRSVSW